MSRTPDITPKQFAESMMRIEDFHKEQRTELPKSENDISQQVRVRNEWHRLLKMEAWERGMHISEVLSDICREHFEKKHRQDQESETKGTDLELGIVP